MRCFFVCVIHGELSIKNGVFLQCDSTCFCKPVCYRTGTCDNRSSRQPRLEQGHICNWKEHQPSHQQLKPDLSHGKPGIKDARNCLAIHLGSQASETCQWVVWKTQPQTNAEMRALWTWNPGVGAGVPMSFPAREWRVQQTSETIYGTKNGKHVVLSMKVQIFMNPVSGHGGATRLSTCLSM